MLLKFFYAKKDKIYPACAPKLNSNCEKQVVLLIVQNCEGGPYLTVKKVSALLREITPKHHGDF